MSSGQVNVLLIGGGGREHALAWKLRQSARCGDLWTDSPGNPGIASLAKAVDVPVDVKQAFRLQRFCDTNKIGLVVIGPEEPLAAGMADILIAPSRAVFGPTAAGARLEADKAWSKQLIRGASVPMAEGRSFTDYSAAKAFVETREDPPVIKASGLAKGKGVIVPESIEEALAALERIMVRLEFGEAGRTVVVEERLEGREVSVMAITDGRTLYVLEPCQDHKRLGDNDTGPNTGGMGAICPGGVHDESTLQAIESQILVPTLDALRRDGVDYRGVLYAGVMLTPAGPKVLEFNCRFGDPECQALVMRLNADLLELMLAASRAPGARRLDEVEVEWSPAASCCVVLASAGYPGKPRTGMEVSGLAEAAKVAGVQVFHGATRRDEQGRVVIAGGRAINVAAVGESIDEARRRAYKAAEMIRFEGLQMRADIGLSGLAAGAKSGRVKAVS